MADQKPIPPETEVERTVESTTLAAAVAELTKARARTDFDMVEQDARAWLALPGRDCDGGDWTDCTESGVWEVRGYIGRKFCTRHAAERLRIADQLAAGVTR